MKKIIMILVATVAVVALGGCSGAQAGGYVVTDTTVHAGTSDSAHGGDDAESLSSVDIQDLDDGYAIRGYSSYGNDVKLLFRDGYYTYQRIDHDSGEVTEEFHGYFELQNGAIKIYFGDDDGGGYAIDTHNGFLEEGYFYDIIGVQDDITVTDIYRI
jgi:hypothetical protein